ncbi:MAG: hypothetical protein HZC02_04190 [Candidatus Levybacteria bacterium]|nr:hypothetical protein [Candidatus Levybacteria bacterium]
MRQSAHSLRLAVSLLLGAMFVIPVASTASAAGSIQLLTASPIPSQVESELCVREIPNTLQNLPLSLVPEQFQRVETTIANAVIISQPKDSLVRSFSPTQTIMTKVGPEDVEEIVTVTPAPLPVVSPIIAASQTAIDSQVGSGSNLSAEVLYSIVNSYRAQVGLPAFQKDERICSVAASRAPELDGEIWVTHTMHAGFHARSLPYWATENVISMRTEQEALTWWLNSPVHRAALLGNWKYACIACSGKSCGMIFTNFDPKIAVVTPVPTTPTPQSAGSAPSAAQTVTSIVK